MDKSPQVIAAFFGCVFSRNFYVPLDTDMPDVRIRLIVENLKPAAVITNMAYYDQARKFDACAEEYYETIKREGKTDPDMHLRILGLFPR